MVGLSLFETHRHRLWDGNLAISTEIKYLVNVRDGDRWTIYTDAPTKGKGIKEAKVLLASGNFDGVKVTEDRGQSQEKIVFEEESSGRTERPVSVTPVDEAPYCKELEEFYSFDARITMGRLMREHLDNVGITAGELIHDKLNILAVVRNDTFYIQILQTITNLQTKGRDEKPADRIDFLENIVKQMQDRTQFADELSELEQILEKSHAGELVQEVKAKIAEDNQNFSIRTILSRYLSGKGDWEGKLVLLLDQIEKDPGDEALIFIDEMLGEIFDGSEAVQEILGYQRNLAAAMTTLVQLAAGSYEISEGSNSPLERMSAVMAKHDLKNTQDIIFDRVGRALAGVNPLTKGDRFEEQDSFRALMRNLIGQKVFANSSQLAEAATLRAKSVLKEKNEDESYEKAVDNMIFLLPTIAIKCGYLLDLTGTEYGRNNQRHIIASLSSVLAGISSVTQIVESGATEKQMVVAAAGLRDRLLATELPEDWRLRFARKIYDLLMAYKAGDTETKIAPPPEVIGKQAEDKFGGTEKSPDFNTRQKKRAPDAPEKAKAPARKSKQTADNLSRRELEHGEYIFREGDEGDEAYLILSGQVNIIRSVGDEEIVIAQVGAGGIIGEMALIDEEPRMASARTATETVLTIIPSKELKTRLDRLEETDPVMRRLVGMFVQRMREARIVSIDS
tara:strand:+ start:6848 stop:8881 length:2034 start_codon:yes stop_codon:yes gene_type:complete